MSLGIRCGCGGCEVREFVEQGCQGAWLHAGFRRPEGDEIAAGAEFAQRLGRVVFVAKQFSSFVGIRESVIRIHKQMSVSANGTELPKQKPNKNGFWSSFFWRPGLRNGRADNMGRWLGCDVGAIAGNPASLGAQQNPQQ